MDGTDNASAIRNPMYLSKPLKVTISYTHTCNLACRHCYAGCTPEPSPRELSGAEWAAFIDYLIDNDVISLLFEGGEPLHRPDFLAVLRHCSRRLLTRVRTNGTLLSPALARELKDIGVGTMLVDFLGARAASHDFMTGVPGAFERARAGVDALVRAGVPTQMLIVMTRQSVGELQDFVALADSLGVDTVGILRLYPIGRAKERWGELALSLDEMMQALADLDVPPHMTLMQSWHPNDGNCCWQMAAVNAYGDSIGCAYLREFVNYGNLKDVPFMETWEHPLYRELRSGRVTDSCPTCEGTQRSCGGCRATAYAFTGRWDAPDPFDAPLNRGVDLRVLPDWLLQEDPGPPRAAGS